MYSSLRIFLKTLPFVLSVLCIKIILIKYVISAFANIQFLQLSEIGVVFTGGFFVMGFMLTGTLSDLKESEKVPSELATHFEIIKEIILDDDRSVQKQIGRAHV